MCLGMSFVGLFAVLISNKKDMKTTATTVRNHKSVLPTKDTDLGDVALFAANVWAGETNVNLTFTNQAAFQTLVTEFRELLNTKSNRVAERRGVTIRLREVDADVMKGLRQVKHYLAQKYDTEATAHLGRFGVVRSGNNYQLPDDQSKKRDALRLMRDAITAEGFGEYHYGTDFWQTTLDRFDALLTEARTLDGAVSGLVAQKNLKRREIRKTLNALVLTLKASEPDDHHGVLRKWGIQRDKF